jgi:hypothetical protein
VTDVIVRLIPSTNKAFITTYKERKAISHGLDTFSIRSDSSSTQISAMTNTRTSQRAESGAFPNRRIIFKRFPAYLAIFYFLKSWNLSDVLPSAFLIAFSGTKNSFITMRKSQHEHSPTNRASFRYWFGVLCDILLKAFKSTILRAITFRMVPSRFKFLSADLAIIPN